MPTAGSGAPGARVVIELAGRAFAVSAPSEILETLRLFYPQLRPAADAEKAATVDFALARANRQWVLRAGGTRIGSYSDPAYALLAMEYEIENAVIAAMREAVALHAGAVEVDGRAWLVAGHPDTGKTTTTFQLLELGGSFLCEEIALYEPSGRRVRPYPQSMSLDSRFVAEFERSYPVTSGTLHPLDAHVTRLVPERVCRTPVELDRVLLPRYRPAAEAAVETLEPEDVLTEFLGYCFPPTAGEERLFEAAIDLLEHARVVRLTYGDLRQARAMLSRLL